MYYVLRGCAEATLVCAVTTSEVASAQIEWRGKDESIMTMMAFELPHAASRPAMTLANCIVTGSAAARSTTKAVYVKSDCLM